MTGFHETKLGDVLTFQRGFDITKSEQSEGTVPIVSSSGISSYHTKAKVKGPGVVIGRKGTLGTVHFLKKDFWPHDTTLWIKDFKGNDPRFLSYFLPALKLENFDVGAANPTLNRNHIHGIKVFIPRERWHQERIAAILSAYDELIENNRRRIALLEKLAEEIYREWFVRLRFPGHEKVKFVKGVPEGWTVLPFSEVAEINPAERIDKDDKRPFVAMERLSESSMYFTHTERRKGHVGPKFRNWDVLFPRITPSVENGKRGLVLTLADGEVAQGSTEFIVFREKVLSAEHIYFLSVSEGFRTNAELSMTGASGRQRVQERCFSQFLVKTPSPPLRERFTSVVRPMVSQIHTLSVQIEALQRTRDLLLPRLISGKLSVEDLDIQFPAGMQSDSEP